MSGVKYQLRVEGLRVPDGTIPVRALVELLQGLMDTAERGLRLAIQGESVKRGKVPAWLGNAVDLTFTGLKLGSTVLSIEAPTLGDTLGGRLQNQQGTFVLVSPQDTALSLVSRSIRDAKAENLESNYYDSGVLNALLGLRGFFKTYAQSVELSVEGTTTPDFIFQADDMDKIERLKKSTPEPQVFVVSGLLDEIEHSDRRFGLMLGDGGVIPGRVDEEFMTVEGMRDFWAKPVTIKGVVYFKPSGKVQLLEAHSIHFAEPGEEIFDEMPIADATPELFESPHPKLGDLSPFNEIRGTWPGDESMGKILETLRTG